MENKCAHWEHFDHQADVGIRGCGATLDEAFEQVALSLSAVVTNPESVRVRKTVEVQCEAADPEALLVDWLNCIIYEGATRKMVFGAFRVRLDEHRLHGTLLGEAIDMARHEPAVEPKGATYTALKVARDPDGCWRAQCVIDV